jgi:nucleoside-diphosphate-sugar epimerase
MQRRVPSIAKIKDLIGFEPSVGIDEIIDSVIEYYRR